jgi:hypothetical protein
MALGHLIHLASSNFDVGPGESLAGVGRGREPVAGTKLGTEPYLAEGAWGTETCPSRVGKVHQSIGRRIDSGSSAP